MFFTTVAIILTTLPLTIIAESVAISCGLNILRLSCRKNDYDPGKAVIIIQRAIYGREDDQTCRPDNVTDLSLYDPDRCQTLVDMTAVIRYHCQFQPSCSFDISKIPFDFECTDIVAYLRVSYNCLPLIGSFPRATSPPVTATTTTTPKPTTTAPVSTTTTTTLPPPPPAPRATTQLAEIYQNSIGDYSEAIADAVISESGAEETSVSQEPVQYPRSSENDIVNGWGTCPECDFCIERSGRLKCFFVLHNLTWPQAKQSCAEMDGELATVRSELESRFLNRTKYILGIHHNNAWIGLRWKQEAKSWLWVDDVALDWELSYSAFAPGAPDNWSGWESCVEFVAGDLYRNELGFYTGYWNDQECLLRRDAICQKYWGVA